MSSFDSLIKDTLISSTSVPRRKRRRPNPSPLPAPTCKVYGERNSGTNYLTNLLRLNTNVVLSSPLFEDGWKHGFPSITHIPLNERPTSIFIFIVRSIPSWLRSMHRRPYHLNVTEDCKLEDFVTGKVQSDEERKGHPVNADARETQGTILDVMERKIAAYDEFLSRNGVRGVLVSLRYVQEQPEKFVRELGERFKGIVTGEKFKGVERHTKTNEVWERGEKGGEGGKEGKEGDDGMEELYKGKEKMAKRIKALEVEWHV